MAVSIDTVYQRVLAIANKEQRGYITPQEFNLFANQAQAEVFEQYFYDLSQFQRAHGNSTEYADIIRIIEDKISNFEFTGRSQAIALDAPGYLATYDSNLITNGTFDSDVLSWALSGNGTQSFDAVNQSLKLKNDATGDNMLSSQTITTVPGALYKVKCYINAGSLNTSGSNPAARAYFTFGTSTSQLIAPGFLSTIEKHFTATSPTTTISLKVDAVGNTDDFALFDNVEVRKANGRSVNLISSTPEGIYRLGTIMHHDIASDKFIDLDLVSAKDMVHVYSSPLTRPTASRPAYVKGSGNKISIYPSSINTSDLYYNYIAKPKKCNWGYNILNEKAMYDSSKSVNFDLHESEQSNLINKILELAGISMQRPDLQQSASARDNKEIQQQKS
jgi:hypothetical protein